MENNQNINLSCKAIKYLEQQFGNIQCDYTIVVDQVQMYPCLSSKKMFKYKVNGFDGCDKHSFVISDTQENISNGCLLKIKNIIVSNFQDQKVFTIIDCQKLQEYKYTINVDLSQDVSQQTTPSIPLRNLNLNNNEWKITTRVIGKTQIKHSEKRTNSRYFIIQMIDQLGDEMSGFFYNNICDLFYDKIELNEIYEFTCGKLSVSTQNNSAKLQIIFNEHTLVKNIEEDFTIPRFNLNLVKINQINRIQENQLVDILCIVESQSEIQEITRLSSNDSQYKILDITDPTGDTSVQIWGNLASISLQNFQIVLLRNLKLKNQKVKQLQSTYQSEIVSNCQDLDQYIQMKNYRECVLIQKEDQIESSDEDQNDIQINDIQNFTQQSKIKLKFIGQQSSSILIATLFYIKDQNEYYYLACNSCKKKLDSKNYCEICKKCSNEPLALLYLVVKITDQTSEIWATVFNSIASKILIINLFFEFVYILLRVNSISENLIGITGNELYQMDKQSQQNYIKNVCETIIMKEFKFKLISKLQQNMNDQEIRYEVAQCDEINYKNECQNILLQLQSFENSQLQSQIF